LISLTILRIANTGREYLPIDRFTECHLKDAGFKQFNYFLRETYLPLLFLEFPYGIQHFKLKSMIWGVNFSLSESTFSRSPIISSSDFNY
jgi:hypothetical protein